MPRRGQAGDVLEGVGAEGHVVRAHDPAALVDPEDGRDVDDEAAALQLLVDYLPGWQVETAASPRGPRDQQDLLAAMLAQRVHATVEIGQREVGRLPRG